MRDVAAHMLQLLQQAQLRDERPADASFLPLSLTLACLLRQLPPGLAPPAGALSFHQLDRLPPHVLARKLETLLFDPAKALGLVASLVQYVRLARALLSVCDEHLARQTTALEAARDVVGAVVDALGVDAQLADDESSEGEGDAATRDDDERSTTTMTNETPASAPRKPRRKSRKGDAPAPTLLRGVDASEAVKRAVGRDAGDGSAVVAIMRKYPADERVQAKAVRALKLVARQRVAFDRSAAGRKLQATSDSDADDDALEPAAAASPATRDAVELVVHSMQQHPDNVALQRDALLCLAEFVSQDARHVAVLASGGGLAAVADALALLPDDQAASVGALSILAHPLIAAADDAVLRVSPESRRLVLAAMTRFPLNEQLQGLSCLALANLSLRHDASMREIVAKGGLEAAAAAMARFPDHAMVQAAGCWLFGIVSATNDEMAAACLDAGALPTCERARVRFAGDPKVQQNALFALDKLAPTDAAATSDAVQQCAVQ